ncbi:Suppressor of fused protein (SUFU) [Jatrophihabitans endophyticus]|uniref:Suppressor of fused protein (SUFU) n=1 Tax=Jatrophihabitans endophyticus TaxID=1206085 RepID=A0A1M5EWI4_9ACTN|nr:suppressor of fused domain protein [Jatrophihabitans endophyticus]SHF83537.1 Suppressor of fused protein (SUFU) [Jatrophihabitans endophyticus]
MNGSVLPGVEAAFVEHFGHRPQRASVSFVGVDPIEVLRFEPIPGERAYLSLGMSRHPMTGGAESFVAVDGPRAELMLHLRDPTDQHADVWRRLAVLAAAPAVESVVYTAGLTVDLGEPLTPGSACTGVVVTESPLPVIAAPPSQSPPSQSPPSQSPPSQSPPSQSPPSQSPPPAPSLPPPAELPLSSPVSSSGVTVFQVLPVTSHELAWARARGSAGLLERLRGPEVDLLDLYRRSVALD